jgi:hypothetical protein
VGVAVDDPWHQPQVVGVNVDGVPVKTESRADRMDDPAADGDVGRLTEAPGPVEDVHPPQDEGLGRL